MSREDWWESEREAPKGVLWWAGEGFEVEHPGDLQQAKHAGECQPKQAGITILLAGEVGERGWDEQAGEWHQVEWAGEPNWAEQVGELDRDHQAVKMGQDNRAGKLGRDALVDEAGWTQRAGEVG